MTANLLSGKRILVVDDEELLREVLSDEFHMHGAEVATAQNGVEALDLVGKTHFDAVFADLRMPGGDGLALIQALNRLQSERPLVFLCSGHSDLSDEEVASLGIAAVFNKPFRREKLVRTMSACLTAAAH